MIIRIVTSMLLCLNVIFIYAIIELRKLNKKLKNDKINDTEKKKLYNEILELQESFKEKTIEAYLYKDKLNRVKKLFKDDKNMNSKFDDIDNNNIYQNKE